MIQFVENDGGRAAAGRRGRTGDCVARAIAIAADLPYADVYRALAEGNQSERRGKRDKRPMGPGMRTASFGINTRRVWFKRYMAELGFEWTATMGIGTGCRVHLNADELPPGRLIVSVSKHYAAVLDGVLHDTYDCSRGGTRCVYGYWRKL